MLFQRRKLSRQNNLRRLNQKARPSRIGRTSSGKNVGTSLFSFLKEGLAGHVQEWGRTWLNSKEPVGRIMGQKSAGQDWDHIVTILSVG